MPDANTEAKKDPKRGTEILRIAVESVDRELAFYRSRSGQIYLVALSAEALIIIGKEQLKFENPGLYSIDIMLDGQSQASIPLLVKHNPPAA